MIDWWNIRCQPRKWIGSFVIEKGAIQAGSSPNHPPLHFILPSTKKVKNVIVKCKYCLPVVYFGGIIGERSTQKNPPRKKLKSFGSVKNDCLFCISLFLYFYVCLSSYPGIRVQRFFTFLYSPGSFTRTGQWNVGQSAILHRLASWQQALPCTPSCHQVRCCECPTHGVDGMGMWDWRISGNESYRRGRNGPGGGTTSI